MPTVPKSGVPPTRTACAVGLVAALLLGTALAGCAYEYDDGSSGGAASASLPPPLPGNAARLHDPGLNQPVSGAGLDAWASQVLPEAEGRVFQSNYGTLTAAEVRKETTTYLPAGSYAITLACRSTRRVAFSIGHDEVELVDLHLRCGSSRVNVVYLSADIVLHIVVRAKAGANFAYRVSRI